MSKKMFYFNVFIFIDNKVFVIVIFLILLLSNLETLEMEQFCGGSSPVIPPRVINTTALRFRFVSNTGNQYEGFRAFFSFHEAASIPEKTEGGMWNCSVPHWPDFKQHFPCNVEVNCAGSEDEEDCPYITEACGKGLSYTEHNNFMTFFQGYSLKSK